MFDNKRILITGGTGSWGHELVSQILNHYEPLEIQIYSRNESQQVKMRRHFDNSVLRFVIGDVRDKSKLSRVVKGIDILFHLAALKHVPVCEEDPWEAILTNIYGTQNAIAAAAENKVEKVIYVSTDKAVNPLNLYGITKACSEKLIISANKLFPETTFACIRAGNVIGTSGSVIPLFRQQILTNNVVTITDKRMTRFFLRLEDAIRLLFTAVEKAIGGEIFIMKMPAIRIIDLSKVMIEELGDKDTKVNFIGIRPGEKIHEVLVSKNESPYAVEDDKFFIILPLIDIPKLRGSYKDMNKMSLKEYNSQNAGFLTNEKIRDLLAKEGWFKTRRAGIADFLNGLSKEEIQHIIERGGWL